MYDCETCYRDFGTQRACNQHMNDTNHWGPTFDCETCVREFRSQNAANQHMNAVGHWTPKIPCETCGKKFHNQNAANQHMNSVGHWAPKIPCETCSLKFKSQAAADQHMVREAHYLNYCKPCNKRFISQNNLKMHLNSKIHRGSTIPCPFCNANYTTASGLSHHLESGSCPRAPQLNRETIYRMARERDPNGFITNNLIGWRDEENATYQATNRAFNGTYWECYICHKKFNTIGSLNAHLNSPTHKQKVYHCPNVKQKCGKQFVSLAALFSHLESEMCSFMRFENVQRQVGNVFQGRNLIAF
ncbi:hypothetical protein FQN50_001891 [Emmonsiellopsis sp. PD_5]|nr:hypothetical protein FQN50_001891 [Emmonsiellopsis sp. PD_5]